MLPRAEKIEAALIGLSVAVVALESTHFPESLEAGALVAGAALALLLQGFARDVCSLAHGGRDRVPGESAACICAESTVGLSGVLVGLAFTLAGVGGAIALKQWVWPVLAALVWSQGFMMKDFVIQWRPWAIRRIKDHGSIIVKLR
jgi:hypothetical protein